MGNSRFIRNAGTLLDSPVVRDRILLLHRAAPSLAIIGFHVSGASQAATAKNRRILCSEVRLRRSTATGVHGTRTRRKEVEEKRSQKGYKESGETLLAATEENGKEWDGRRAREREKEMLRGSYNFN